MIKATAVAPANIALIKYWGKKDKDLRIPENSSIAINQSNLYTTTTVEFSSEYKNDIVEMNGKKPKGRKLERVIKHLDRIRKLANISYTAKVVSQNNFPTSAGLASSASGFAALTVAATKAAGLDLSKRELSRLARIASGSACRSIPDGFVEWIAGDDDKSSYANSLYLADYWDITLLAVVVDAGEKDISTTQGHKLAESSPFMDTRLKRINGKITQMKKYLEEKDFTRMGELAEAEAIEMHAVMMTSTPPLFYWLPSTLRIIHAVHQWRKGGLEAYFTIDAGPHPHILCKTSDANKLTTKLKKIEGIKKIIPNKPSSGTRLSRKHLF